MLQALREGTQTEAQLSALRLILEYGTQQQQAEAMKKISAVAYGSKRKKKGITHILQPNQYKSQRKTVLPMGVPLHQFQRRILLVVVIKLFIMCYLML
jgi:hypothetical protein